MPMQVIDGSNLMPDTVVETDRLLIREWLQDDWRSLRALTTNRMVLRYLGDGQPWSDERTQKFVDGGIEQSAKRGWVLWPVISKQNHELIGICGFNSSFPPEVEIGWWLLPEYWGRGLATEAARAILEYGFNKFRFPKVISVAQPANVASIKIMQKLGMQFEKRFVHDGVEVVCYFKAAPAASA